MAAYTGQTPIVSIRFRQLNHNFVSADNAKVLPNKLVSQVRIDPVRVQQRNLLLKIGPVNLQLRRLEEEFRLLLAIATPT